MSASPADELRVRPADVADSEAIARVHVESWRAAYRGLLPGGYLASLSVAGRARRWRSRLRTVPARETVLVAEHAGGVVAFCSVGPARDGDCDPEWTGELYAIYAVEAEWGRGTGRALHEAAVGALRAARFADAVLWVLETNARARRFYERCGWRPDGAAKEETYGRPVVEVRYRRPL